MRLASIRLARALLIAGCLFVSSARAASGTATSFASGLKGTTGKMGDPTTSAALAIFDARYVLKTGDRMAAEITFAPALVRDLALSSYEPVGAATGATAPAWLLGPGFTVRASAAQSEQMVFAFDLPSGAGTPRFDCITHATSSPVVSATAFDETWSAAAGFTATACGSRAAQTTSIEDLAIISSAACTLDASNDNNGALHVRTMKVDAHGSADASQYLYYCGVTYEVPSI